MGESIRGCEPPSPGSTATLYHVDTEEGGDGSGLCVGARTFHDRGRRSSGAYKHRFFGASVGLHSSCVAKTVCSYML